MLHLLQNKGKAFKLTNHFSAGFSYSPSFALFLFAIIIAIIIIEEMIGIIFISKTELTYWFYTYSFIVFSYSNSDKKNNSDIESPDELDNYEDDDDDDSLYSEPGLKRYSAEEYDFAFGGSLSKLACITDKDFIEKLKTYIDSIEIKDNHLYYVGIYVEKLMSEERYGNALIVDNLNIYSLLIRRLIDRKNINYINTYKEIMKNLNVVVAEYEEHDSDFICPDTKLLIEFKEINMLDESKRKLLKALDLDNLNTTNMKTSDFIIGRGVSSDINYNKKNKSLNGKRLYSTSNENPPHSLGNNNLKLDKKTAFLTYSPVYLKIKEIYEDKNKSLIERQKEVEYLIHEKWLDLYTSTNKANNGDAFLLLNIAMNKFLIKLSNYFNTKKKSFKKFIPLIEMKKHDIAFIVFNELKPILNLGKEINSTTLSGNIGKSLYDRWIRELYISEKELDSNLDFNKFKEDHIFKEEDYHDVGDLLRQILLEDDDLFYRRIDKSDPKDTKAFITASYKVQQMFEHHHDVIGLQLAMICPPVKWNDGTYGGFLRNEEKLFIDLITPSSKSKMKSVIENKLIYDSVNYLSSTPYKINTEVLDFINLNADEIGLLQNLHPETNKLEEYYGILNNKIKDKTINKFSIKKIVKDVLSYNSNYYLEKNILGLANLYSLVDEFFFTISLDWRGRLYSESTYLNFQGNDLSKALILFKNGRTINTEGLHYLKIYGANLYGNNKLSFMDRVKWIDENNENILNMNLDFINKADKKFLFIAFCFEYKNYLSNPVEFRTHLPILLDASCNGMQHLSAMIGDSVIAKNVNLLENDPYLKPYDFYTFCLKLVKNKLDSIDPDDVNYIRIRNLKLDRSVVKRTIMTIPYNVSIHTITTQLSEFFEEVKINNEILLKPTWYTPDSELYISYKELYFLANLIHQTLYEEHPKLKAVVRYFSDVAICLTKLNLPIMWNTPAGLTIKQNYVKFKKHIVKSSLYYKASSYTINLPTTQLSLKNQKSSFMPNLIHSMDASNIYLLVDKILKANLEINIFTVHDCFATTAETMPLLNRLVRSSFIELYSDNEYLNRMDKFYRNYIIENGYIIEENNIILENKDILSKEEIIKIEIPQPPISENLHLDEMIDKAIYLIH